MAHSESKPTHKETEREKKDPTRCIHQPHSVSHSPLMAHRETEQNRKERDKPSAAHHDTSAAQKANKSSFTESAEIFVID